MSEKHIVFRAFNRKATALGLPLNIAVFCFVLAVPQYILYTSILGLNGLVAMAMDALVFVMLRAYIISCLKQDENYFSCKILRIIENFSDDAKT
jgi:type IV secretory pathway VirB3-like protein